MRYAIIENNIVVNIIVANQDFIDANYPSAVACNDSVNIGWIWDGTNFIVPAPIVIEVTE